MVMRVKRSRYSMFGIIKQRVRNRKVKIWVPGLRCRNLFIRNVFI